jgi:ADP-ribose pyrophosphatase
MFPSPGILDEKMHIFIATELTKGTQKFDDDEEISIKPFSFKELRIQLKANNIKDGKTIASLGYLMVFKPWLGA